jgi:predicted metal-dependent TIM-barrel fold hydrolase
VPRRFWPASSRFGSDASETFRQRRPPLGGVDAVRVALQDVSLSWPREQGGAMPIVHECASEDCKVLTMGEFCLDHERRDELAVAASVVTLARKTDAPIVPETAA